MGKRVEGRKKQKSIKANVTSKFSSKRKLSRMGKKVKAGKAGPNTEFITRSAALRKLQITLKDFRRLCILKGIYPRVPAKGLQGNDKVYYDIKDISYIMHEPLLHKFREFKAFMKKIRKAAGRNQFEEARRKNALKPKFSLDHLVKERYPRFIDALRDLDDALCMIHLFAALPSSGRITAEHTSTCSRLAREWQFFVAKSRSLQKVFVSVKGVYFQAEILGEPITWLVPHAFTQSVPREVDLRVMVTFLEFYEVFVQFVLFKLYHLRTWRYPPQIHEELEAEGCCLLAMKADSLAATEREGEKSQERKDTTKTSNSDNNSIKKSKKIQAIDISSLLKGKKGSNSNSNNTEGQTDEDKEEEDEEEEEEEEDISGPLSSVFSDLQSFHHPSNKNNNINNNNEEEEETKRFNQETDNSSRNKGLLFDKLVFFVNREVPLDWCQLCITAFGGKIGWDSPLSPLTVDDKRITHQIVDRPLQTSLPPSSASKVLQQREVVQPQWLFDSINAGILLPTRNYAPGVALPPHLSPFVNDDKEGYVPKYREEIKQLQKEREGKEGKTEEEIDEEEEEEEEPEELEEVDDFASKQNDRNQEERNEHGDEDSEDDNSEEEEEEEEEEKKKMVVGKETKKGPKAIVYQKKETPVDEATEVKDLAKQMMKKKTKRLYDRMQHGIEKKQQQISSLLQKRKALEEEEDEPPSNQKNTKTNKTNKKAKKDQK